MSNYDDLLPDAPAMPVQSHEAVNWNTPVPHSLGLTARQHAAITLRVPDSGTEWLDAMIRASLRDELAARVMQGMAAASGCGGVVDFDDATTVASAYALADEMLAARGA